MRHGDAPGVLPIEGESVTDVTTVVSCDGMVLGGSNLPANPLNGGSAIVENAVDPIL